MPRRNSDVDPIQPDKGTLEEHRQYLLKIGKLINGKRALSVEEHEILVLQRPDATALDYVDEVKETEYGILEALPDGTLVAQPSGKEVLVAGTPKQILDFVSEMRQLTMNKRRDLAIEANREHTRSYTKPGGRKGHLLEEYDNLLDQLDALFYRLRDKLKETHPA